MRLGRTTMRLSINCTQIANDAATVVQASILFYFGVCQNAKLVHDIGMQELYFILFSFILLQTGERFNSILSVNS